MRPMPAVPMPLTLGDLRRACTYAAGARQRLEDAVAAYHEANAGFGVSSGRAALWLTLWALHRTRPDRGKVILPAYTCPTVGRSVVEAGLQGACADVSLDTLNIDPGAVAEAIDERVLAVVAPHMFGVPCDVGALQKTCREHGAYLIEDCAQCVGGRWAGQRVGTFGDVGFLSMGRSKNVRGYEGGVVWTNCPQLVKPLREEFEQLPDARVSMKHKLKQAAITVLSQPHLWAIAKRLPGLKVGAEDQSFDPHPSKLADWQAGLGLISLGRLDEFNERRRELASALRNALADVDGLHCQTVPDQAEPTCLRFATRLTRGQPGARDGLVTRLQAMDIDARAFYARPMPEYEWWHAGDGQPAFERAAETVRSNLILPLHYSMSEPQITRLAQAVSAGVNAGK